MARKRTPKRQLVDLYEKAIKESIESRYHLHEDMGKYTIKAAQDQADEDYRNAVKLFTTTLDEVTDPLEDRIESLKWECMEASMGEDF